MRRASPWGSRSPSTERGTISGRWTPKHVQRGTLAGSVDATTSVVCPIFDPASPDDGPGGDRVRGGLVRGAEFTSVPGTEARADAPGARGAIRFGRRRPGG